MEIYNDSENKYIYHEIIKDDTEFKFNDVTNVPKSFGFRTATKNIQISVVLIKRVWKRRGKITKYLRKKKFKSKTKDKEGTNNESGKVENTNKSIKGVKTINPTEFTGDRQWCWNEFERHIGVPKRWDVSPSFAISYIRAKRFQRFVPEAKNIRKPSGTDSVFLSANKPTKTCFCPDHECLCLGNTVINKNKRIPSNCKCLWNLTKYFQSIHGLFAKKANVDDFVKKMLSSREETDKKMILSKDVCIGRCKHCYVTDTPQIMMYLPDFLRRAPTKSEKKDDAEVKQLPAFEVLPDIDEKICNVVFCTVAIQTETGPDGQLLPDPFSPVLFSKQAETYLPDIRGKKLQITPYTHVSPKEPDMQDYARKMEKLLDFKEMKARLSQFISSVYVIKDPGTPVRTSSTQVPWRKRICDTCDTCPSMKPPNRCGDEDFDNIPEVPWRFKMQEVTSQETKKDESDEDEKDDRCPCCELFVKSDVDKSALLQDMRNILSLPGDVTISNNQLEKDEKISDVNIIIEKVVANTLDDIDDNIQNKETDLQKVDKINQEKGNTTVKKERNQNIINVAKIVKEVKENVITNENRYHNESVDKNLSQTKEIITGNDNSEVNSLINAGKASDEITTEESGNNKKRGYSDFLGPKKPSLLSSSTTIKQKSSESLARNKNSKIINATDVEIYSSEIHSENDVMEINNVLQNSDDQGKQELSKDLSNTTKLHKQSSIKNSKILTEKKVSSNIQNTSNKIVLQVNTSYKKASSAFSSLFKWLYGQSVQMSQFNKILSEKSESKNKYSIDDTHLNEKYSKISEKEVFSIRYTSSTISVNKSTSSGVDNN